MAEVNFFDAEGRSAGYGFTDSNGSYESRLLCPGTYFAKALAGWGSTIPYAQELYQDIPCLPACDPTSGTPLQVGLGTEVSGIDFDLQLMAAISGTVEDTNGIPLTDVQVWIYDDNGDLSFETWGIPLTGYVSKGLPPGMYFVVVRSSSRIDELWDYIPCELGCDPTSGTPVLVNLNEIVSGIDFVLEHSSWIGGSVRDEATDVPIDQVPVEVFAADGTLIGSTSTDVGGDYLYPDVPSGGFYVRYTRGLLLPDEPELPRTAQLRAPV